MKKKIYGRFVQFGSKKDRNSSMIKEYIAFINANKSDMASRVYLGRRYNMKLEAVRRCLSDAGILPKKILKNGERNLFMGFRCERCSQIHYYSVLRCIICRSSQLEKYSVVQEVSYSGRVKKVFQSM